jgi:hypothetical protein
MDGTHFALVSLGGIILSIKQDTRRYTQKALLRQKAPNYIMNVGAPPPISHSYIQ